MVTMTETAVALVCAAGHREFTLKAHWSPQGLGAKCSRCGLQLTVEREAAITVRSTAPIRTKHRRVTFHGPPAGLCDICAQPISEHLAYNRHPRR